MKRVLFAISGIIGLLVGLGFIMPAAALWQRNGPEGRDVMGPIILGGLIVIAALFALIRAILPRRA